MNNLEHIVSALDLFMRGDNLTEEQEKEYEKQGWKKQVWSMTM